MTEREVPEEPAAPEPTAAPATPDVAPPEAPAVGSSEAAVAPAAEIASTPEAPEAPATPDAEASKAPAAPPRDDRGERPRGGRGGGGGGRRFGRRKVCTFCVEKAKSIDYKDPGKLRRYLSDRGRIEARRKTGTCAKHQRWLALALKRARHLALMPYSPEHIRVSGLFGSRR